MIKLDPEEEVDDDDEDKTLNKPNQMQKQVVIHPSGNVQQSGGNSNTQTINNVHMNNVQINLTRVNLPSEFQNYVRKIYKKFNFKNVYFYLIPSRRNLLT